jgi:hypothetical protein
MWHDRYRGYNVASGSSRERHNREGTKGSTMLSSPS